MIRIRPLAPHEADLHREVRLRALRDAPDAFADRFANVAARPRSYWEDGTRSLTGPGRHAMFLACEGDAVRGMAYGIVDEARADTARLGGLWVEPSARRRGIGRALVDAVCEWAAARGLREVRLWVAESPAAARALYAGAGFGDTGRRRPLPSNPAITTLEMVRVLPRQVRERDRRD